MFSQKKRSYLRPSDLQIREREREIKLTFTLEQKKDILYIITDYNKKSLKFSKQEKIHLQGQTQWKIEYILP